MVENRITTMEEYHLDLTKTKLSGPTQEQITVHNQWAAVAFDKFHQGSTAIIEFNIEGAISQAKISWNSTFSSSAMKEHKDMANHGGVAIAWFIMSVLKDYGYVEQSEIGEGVDYRFMKNEPDDDSLNFLEEEHYVEVSGILQESPTNTMQNRIATKHAQIAKGSRRDQSSSVIVTLFSGPKAAKVLHP